jgi:homoserine dehydrogenase
VLPLCCSDTTELHIRALSLGAAVALANKVPATAALPRYAALTAQPRRFRAESTVGAGLPVHAALSRFNAAGDPISRIAGAFSGTLGYVMSGARAAALVYLLAVAPTASLTRVCVCRAGGGACVQRGGDRRESRRVRTHVHMQAAAAHA